MADRRRGAKGSLLHELRTPLTQIIGYAEMLAEEAQETGPQEHVEPLQTIAKAGRLLTRLIEDHFRTAAVTGDVRVLVVDQSEQKRDELLRRLRSQGYMAAEAVDGTQAPAALEARDFDLVILDVGMPGIEALRGAWEKRPAFVPPVIVATAGSAADEVIRALEASLRRVPEERTAGDG